MAVAFACGSLAVAEDAVQEALVRAWVKAERGEDIESLPAWVTTVAMNLSRNALRRVLAERRARERLRADASPVAHPYPDEVLDVQRTIAGLPRRQREVAVLRYVLELDTREVAGALGIDEGTVKSHLARARTKLVEALGQPEVTRDVAT